MSNGILKMKLILNKAVGITFKDALVYNFIRQVYARQRGNDDHRQDIPHYPLFSFLIFKGFFRQLHVPHDQVRADADKYTIDKEQVKCPQKVIPVPGGYTKTCCA